MNHVRNIWEQMNDNKIPSRTPEMSTQTNVNSLLRELMSMVMLYQNVERQIDFESPVQLGVALKALPNSEILHELLKPTTLVPDGRPEHGWHFRFFINNEQAAEIKKNSEVGADSEKEFSVEVLFRFSCDQPKVFPSSLDLIVNGKHCLRPDNSDSICHQPINITDYIKLDPQLVNRVSLSWATDLFQMNIKYYASISIVKTPTVKGFFNRLKMKDARPAEDTIKMIKSQFSEEGPDSDITMDVVLVSLVCPVSKLRMSDPCRSVSCTHLECFDALTFFEMNVKKTTWKCPICNKEALFDHLVIDGYFREVLNSTILPSNSRAIQVHKDGSWSSYETKTVVAPHAREAPVQEPMETETPVSNETVPFVVDLTLSESDDEA